MLRSVFEAIISGWVAIYSIYSIYLSPVLIVCGSPIALQMEGRHGMRLMDQYDAQRIQEDRIFNSFKEGWVVFKLIKKILFFLIEAPLFPCLVLVFMSKNFRLSNPIWIV